MNVITGIICQALLSAIPVPDTHNRNKRIVLKGEITSPIDPGEECRFSKRCLYADECCKASPELVEVSSGHFVACHHCGCANRTL